MKAKAGSRQAAESGPLRDQHILVTGGAGFLGVHLAQELAAQGARLVLQDTAVKRPEQLGPLLRSGRATLVVCDLARLDESPALLGWLPEIDYVVHLGLAFPPVHDRLSARTAYREANLLPFERLLRRLPARVKAVCLASTLSVCGAAHPAPLAENQPAMPNDPLAEAKTAMEQALMAYGQSVSKPVTIVRLATLYGPGEAHLPRTIPSFIRSLLDCLPPVIYGDGSDVHDYLYVTDAARGMRQALEQVSVAPGIYHLGTGHGWTTRAVADKLQRLLGNSLPPKHMPRRSPHQCLIANIARAQQCLGFDPQVELEDGLTAEIQSCQASQIASADTSRTLTQRPSQLGSHAML